MLQFCDTGFKRKRVSIGTPHHQLLRVEFIFSFILWLLRLITSYRYSSSVAVFLHADVCVSAYLSNCTCTCVALAHPMLRYNSIQTSIQVETAAQIAIYSHAEQACELGHELEGART